MKRVSDSPTAQPPSQRTKKTKYSFLRWLHKRNALNERALAPGKEKAAPPLAEPLAEPPLAEPLSEELMNWVDDGGSVEQKTPIDKTPID